MAEMLNLWESDPPKIGSPGKGGMNLWENEPGEEPKRKTRKAEEQKPEELRGFFGETVSALGAGVIQTMEGIAATAEMIGVPGGETARKEWQRIGQSDALRRPDYLQDVDIWENPETLSDWRWWVRSLGENTPNLVAMYIPGVAAARAAQGAAWGARAITLFGQRLTAARIAGLGGAYAGSFTLEAGGAYGSAKDEMTREGILDADTIERIATLEGLTAGATNAVIELLPFDNLILKQAGADRLVKRLIRQGFVEGATEGVQEAVNIAVEKLGHKPDQAWSDNIGRILESAIIGGALGAGAGGTIGTAVHRGNIKRYETLGEKLGLTDLVVSYKDQGVADKEIAAEVEKRVEELRGFSRIDPADEKKAAVSYALGGNETKETAKDNLIPEIDAEEMTSYLLYATGRYEAPPDLFDRITGTGKQALSLFGIGRKKAGKAAAAPAGEKTETGTGKVSSPAPIVEPGSSSKAGPEIQAGKEPAAGGMPRSEFEAREIAERDSGGAESGPLIPGPVSGKDTATAAPAAEAEAKRKKDENRKKGETLFDLALNDVSRENQERLEAARLQDEEKKRLEEARLAGEAEAQSARAVAGAANEARDLTASLAGEDPKKQAIVAEVLGMSERVVAGAVRTELGIDVQPAGQDRYEILTDKGPQPVTIPGLRKLLAEKRIGDVAAAEAAHARDVEAAQTRTAEQKAKKEKETEAWALANARETLRMGRTLSRAQLDTLQAARGKLEAREIELLDKGPAVAEAAVPQSLQALGVRPKPAAVEEEKAGEEDRTVEDHEDRARGYLHDLLMDSIEAASESKTGWVETEEGGQRVAAGGWISAVVKTFGRVSSSPLRDDQGQPRTLNLSKAYLARVIDKARAGEELTEDQAAVYEEILGEAKDEAGRAYRLAEEEAEALADFEPETFEKPGEKKETEEAEEEGEGDWQAWSDRQRRESDEKIREGIAAGHDINKNGVYQNREDIEIPFTKSAKTSARIHIATGPDGKFRSAHNFNTSYGSHSGGGSYPSIFGEAYDTRAEAIQAEIARLKHILARSDEPQAKTGLRDLQQFAEKQGLSALEEKPKAPPSQAVALAAGQKPAEKPAEEEKKTKDKHNPAYWDDVEIVSLDGPNLLFNPEPEAIKEYTVHVNDETIMFDGDRTSDENRAEAKKFYQALRKRLPEEETKPEAPPEEKAEKEEGLLELKGKWAQYAIERVDKEGNEIVGPAMGQLYSSRTVYEYVGEGNVPVADLKQLEAHGFQWRSGKGWVGPVKLYSLPERAAANLEKKAEEKPAEAAPAAAKKTGEALSDEEFASLFNEAAEEVEAEKKAAPKEPWQMTRDEYLKSLGMDDRFTPPQPKKEGARLVRLSADNVITTGEHGQAVFNAIQEGKPVPAEVRAEYPEFEKIPEKPAASQGVTTAIGKPAEKAKEPEPYRTLPAAQFSAPALAAAKVLTDQPQTVQEIAKKAALDQSAEKALQELTQAGVAAWHLATKRYSQGSTRIEPAAAQGVTTAIGKPAEKAKAAPEAELPPLNLSFTKQTGGIWKGGYQATVTEGPHKGVVGFAHTKEGAQREVEKSVRERVAAGIVNLPKEEKPAAASPAEKPAAAQGVAAAIGKPAEKAKEPPAAGLTLAMLNHALSVARGGTLNGIAEAINSFNRGDIEGARLLAAKAQAGTATDLGFGAAIGKPAPEKKTEAPAAAAKPAEELPDLTVSGQSKPVPGRPGASYVVHKRQPDLIPDTFRVLVNRTEGGILSVDGTGMDAAAAYKNALANYDRKLAEWEKNKPKPKKVEGAEFQEGDRVVITSGRGEGRHGAISNVSSYTMRALFMGTGKDTSERHFSYTMRSDAGTEYVVSSGNLAREEGAAPAVVPDVEIEGRFYEPDHAHARIRYAKEAARKHDAAAQRARKPANIQEERRLAQENRGEAAKLQGIFDAWAAQYPKEAEEAIIADEGPAAAKPAAASQGVAIATGQRPAAMQPGGAPTMAGAAKSLADLGLTVSQGKTNTGKTVWNVSGNTRAHSEQIKRAGGRWYGPKKVWSFYNGDPTAALQEALGIQAGAAPAAGVKTAAGDDARILGKNEDGAEVRQRVRDGARYLLDNGVESWTVGSKRQLKTREEVAGEAKTETPARAPEDYAPSTFQPIVREIAAEQGRSNTVEIDGAVMSIYEAAERLADRQDTLRGRLPEKYRSRIPAPAEAKQPEAKRGGYAAEIKVRGEDWSKNALVFATEKEAEEYGQHKLGTWGMAEDARVVPVDKVPNWEFRDGALERIEDKAKPAPSLGKAASEVAEGVASSFDAIAEILKKAGKGPISMMGGGVFDEELYAAIKPHLQATYDHFRAAAIEVKEWMKEVVRQFTARGFAPDALMPYLQRFYREVAQKDLTKPETGITLESQEGGDRYGTAAGTARSGDGTAENDRTGAQGPGAALLEGVEGGREAGGVPEGSRTGDDGKLRPGGIGAPHEGARPAGPEGLPGEGAAVDYGGEPGVGGDTRDLAGVQRPAKPRDHRIASPGDLTRPGSWLVTAKNNLDIIDLVKQIERENRPATPAEQRFIARYTGFGASEMRNKLFEGYARTGELQPDYVDAAWKPLVERMVELLTPEEIRTMARSTQYAHYTSGPVVQGIYRALERLGFPGGRILEPGMGTGHFWGLMPEAMRGGSRYTGVEMDHLTASIAKVLYPEQNILEADYSKQAFPNNFFDAAVGNPPFAKTVILADPDYKRLRLSLHNYFFVKSLDKIRPGGILAFVTSHYTMDAEETRAREQMAERADLVGAIRLPDTAFKANAGTEVVTDILFFRKRAAGEEPAGEKWINRVRIQIPEVDGKPSGVEDINEYFAAHPEMVLGTHSLEGKMYRDLSYTVKSSGDLEAQLAEAAGRLPENVYSTAQLPAAEQQELVVERDFNPANRKEGGLYVAQDGKLMRTDRGSGVPFRSLYPDFVAREIEWLKDYCRLRDTLKQAQYDQLKDGPWEDSLQALREVYDRFVFAHGKIRDFALREKKETDEDGNETVVATRIYRRDKLLRRDVEAPLVTALEEITEDGTILPGPFLRGRTIRPPAKPQIRGAADALAVTLDEAGKLDLDRVAEAAGLSREEAIAQLGDLIYEVPGAGHALADEYLSGDVVKKLEEAQAAAAADPKYRRNVEALLKVQPQPLAARDVTVALGGNWIPLEHYDDFAEEVLGLDGIEVGYRASDNNWTVEIGSATTRRRGRTIRRTSGRQSLRGSASEWGTGDRGANELLDSALNSRVVRITHRQRDGSTIVDTAASQACNDIIKRMKERFSTWVWEEAARASELLNIYNRKFNNLAGRLFDGSHMTLPGLSLLYKLHDHQKRAIWRIVQTGNAYLAHAVGSGKTLEMICAGMEMKRLGLIQKPLYIVPNHMLQQFSSDFQAAYPLAHVMIADEQNFGKENRRNFVAQATLNKPDAIVLTHSAFGLLKVTEATVAPVRDDLIAQLRATLEELRESNVSRARIQRIEQRIEQVEQRFAALTYSGNRDDVVNFEEMGVDYLFVDEAHMFRKLDFDTNRQVKGIDPAGSNRGMDLYIKTRWLEAQKPGRSHSFASGTPITNTIAELYTLMRFFIEPDLQREDLGHFDAWANLYAVNRVTPEMNAAGRYEMVERFSEFINIPEMMSRVRTFMDILTASQLAGVVDLPTIRGGKAEIVVTQASEGLKDYQRHLEARIRQSRDWRPSPGQKGNPDPLINIITDGRLASIDLRYVRPGTPNDPRSKLNSFLDGVIESWKEAREIEYTDSATGKVDPVKGGSIVVFYNHGFGANVAETRDFDARGWAMQRFREAGIPANEVGWIDDADNAEKKADLFKAVRQGHKRILIGSAKKMGTGMNVQRRLIALHYLDPPWYPADVEQPDGRIVRQGNLNTSMNREVVLKRYATKGSYDATMWQMVARKSRFTEQAMLGDPSIRKLADLSEASQYEMAAAVASGDERVIRLANLRADRERLQNLQWSHVQEQTRIHGILSEREAAAAYKAKRLKLLAEADKKSPGYIRQIDGQVGEARFDERDEFGRALIEAYNRTAPAEKLVTHAKEVEWTKIAEMDGFDLLRKNASVYNALVLRLAPGLDIELETQNTLDPEKTSPLGLTTRIVNQINGISTDIRSLEDGLEEDKKEVAQARKRIGAPFAYERELAEKIAEIAQLEQELVEEGRAAEAAARAGHAGHVAPTTLNTNPVDQDLAALHPADGGPEAPEGGTPGEQYALGDVTETPAFKKWFGASKVVDAEGKPLVVYHGTHNTFDAFDMEASGDIEIGQYFTNRESVAEDYGVNVMPVYLSIRNPYETTSRIWFETFNEDARDIQKRGFDGIVVRGPLHSSSKNEVTYIPFSPSQVKSVNNRGTFDAADARIQYALGPEMNVADFSKDPAWHDIAYKEATPEALARLKRWLRENPAEKSVRLYHGTAASVPVLEEGLRATTGRTAKSLQARAGTVSLSMYPGHARDFARMAYPGKEIAVYAVDVPVNDLIPDTDQLKNKRYWGERPEIGTSLADSLAYGHGAQLRGNIPAYRIRPAELPQYAVGEKESLEGEEVAELVRELTRTVGGISAETRGGEIYLKTQGGQVCRIKGVTRLAANRIQLDIGYSQAAMEKQTPYAVFHPATEERSAEIHLVRGAAGAWTINHEFYHWLEDLGVVTNRDKNLLNRKIESLIRKDPKTYGRLRGLSPAERRADWTGRQLAGMYDATTETGKILARIRGLIDRILNALGIRTAGGVVRDIQSGKIVNRPGIPGTRRAAAASYAMAGKNAIGQQKLDVAEQMEAEGISRDRIWGETGWWKLGEEWKFEIDDSEAFIRIQAGEWNKKLMDTPAYTLPGILQHPTLYRAYPKLKGIKVHSSGYPSMLGGIGSKAFYDDKNKEIHVLGPAAARGGYKPVRKTELKSVLFHEVQHVIQDMEDFARGGDVKEFTILDPDAISSRHHRLFTAALRFKEKGNPEEVRQELLAVGYEASEIEEAESVSKNTDAETLKKINKERDDILERAADPYKSYRLLAGEAESRLVQKRLEMMPEDRKWEPPWITLENMLREEGILREGQNIEDALIRLPRKEKSEQYALGPEGGEAAGSVRAEKLSPGESLRRTAEELTGAAGQAAGRAGSRALGLLGARVSPETKDALGVLARHWKEFWRPFSTVKDGEKILAKRYEAMGNVARAVRFIEEIHQKLDAYPPEVKKDMFWYLNGDIPLEILPVDARETAEMIRRRFETIGEMLVDRGLLAQGQFDKYRGRYIHYLYARHVLGDKFSDAFLTSTGKLNLSYAKSRKDLTLQQRKELGLIEDASVAVPVGMGKALTDLAKADYLETIAENADWVWQPSLVKVPIGKPLKEPVRGRTRRNVTMGVGKLVEELKAYDRMMEAAPTREVEEIRNILRAALDKAEAASHNMPGDFVQLPNSKGYGALAGAYVKKPIADDLMPILDVATDRGKLFNAALEIERQGMAVFKMGKVALNLPTAVRNVVSNIIQNNMRGRPLSKIPGDIIRACEELKAKGTHYEEAFGMGLFHTNWFVSEINDVLDEFKKVKGGRIDQILIALKNVAKYYGKIDDINKLAIFIEQRKAGKTVDEAALEAMKWGMDYSLTSRSIKGLRQTIMPFATYQYKIAPLIAESLRKRPWVLAKYGLLFTAAKAAAMALHDLDDDDWDELERQLPAYIKKAGSMMILPWQTDKGQWQWVNLEYFFPWGNYMAIFRDMRQADLGETIRDAGISNPFLSMFVTGITAREDQPPLHAYFGTPIYNDLDPGWMKAAKVVEYMANTWMPSMLTRQGAIGYTGRAIAGGEDRWGREVTGAQALGRWFGANIVSVSPDQTRAQASVRIQEKRKELSRIEANPSYDEKEKAAYRQRFNEELAEVAKEAPAAVLPITKAKGPDPVYEALRGMAAAGSLHTGPPSRSVEIAGVPLKMTPAQYGRYLEASSETARRKLLPLVGSEAWARMSDQRKGETVAKIVAAARKAARQRIKAEVARENREKILEARRAR